VAIAYANRQRSNGNAESGTTRRTRTPSDPARDAAIAAAYGKGLTVGEIRKKFGLPSDSQIYRAIHRHGVPLRSRSPDAGHAPRTAALRRTNGRRPVAEVPSEGRANGEYTYRLSGTVVIRATSAFHALDVGASMLDDIATLERID
jgi:transposase-like protein